MSKKKKLKKQLHDVSCQRLCLHDSAETVKSMLSVARFVLATKEDGIREGFLSDNDCVTLEDLVCDIISDCYDMLSDAQQYKE